MLVVDDADVFDSVLVKLFDDGDLVFGFAEPSAVVVEADGAIDFSGGASDGAEAGAFILDAAFLFLGIRGGRSAAGDPELSLEIVPFENVEDEFCLVVESGREPPGEELNVLFL